MIIKIPIKPNLFEDLNRKFIELPSYSACCEGLELTEDEKQLIQNKILKGEGRQDAPPGLNGAKKLRVQLPSKNKGAQGGLRSVYVDIIDSGIIYLIYVYYKGDSEDLTPSESKMVKNAVIDIKKEND